MDQGLFHPGEQEEPPRYDIPWQKESVAVCNVPFEHRDMLEMHVHTYMRTEMDLPRSSRNLEPRRWVGNRKPSN